MKRYIPTFILGLLVAGCAAHPPVATPEPIVTTQEVDVPVPAPSCVPDSIKAPPAYVDTDAALKAAADAAVRYQMLWAGRSQRNSRLNEIEPVIAACHAK